MKPTKELLSLARDKAISVFKQNNSMQSIRLTADETSYTLFNVAGINYIGSYDNESLVKFFKNKHVYELINNKTGKVTAKMQRL